jgi:hypothetical protein
MYERPSHFRPAHLRRGEPRWGLLVESADPVLAISDHTAFLDAGFDVTVCPGPVHEASECPLVRGEPCPLADAADVMFFDTDRGPCRSEILDAVRTAKPDLPVVVRSADRHVAGSGARTIPMTTSVAGQVSALRQAVLAR